jgi:hypothetical protein
LSNSDNILIVATDGVSEKFLISFVALYNWLSYLALKILKMWVNKSHRDVVTQLRFYVRLYDLESLP